MVVLTVYAVVSSGALHAAELTLTEPSYCSNCLSLYMRPLTEQWIHIVEYQNTSYRSTEYRGMALSGISYMITQHGDLYFCFCACDHAFARQNSCYGDSLLIAIKCCGDTYLLQSRNGSLFAQLIAIFYTNNSCPFASYSYSYCH